MVELAVGKHLEELREYRRWTGRELDRCVHFWLENGMDPVNGGIYTCVERDGSLYSRDKGVWMQGRAAWMFSLLCNRYGPCPELLGAAKSCIDFMEKACFSGGEENWMYLALPEKGTPVSQRGQCFSEAFYTIANAEYGMAARDEGALERARRAYERVWQRNHGLVGGPKTIVGDGTGRAHADPMIYLNVSSVLRRCDPENAALYERRGAECAEEIIRYHFKPEFHCTLEKVSMDGGVCDLTPESRAVNPGHDLECCWFLMEEANRQGNRELHRKAEQMFLFAVNAGWDLERGGLLSFVDYRDGSIPSMRLADKKLWWPHCEALVASLMLYRDTGEEGYWDWFNTFADYCKRNFSDPEYGEWYNQLELDGRVANRARKGHIFKGPFHVPRMLEMVTRLLDGLIEKDTVSPGA